ncbi:MAG: hypothetical protein ACXW03_04735 [Methylobacter sp.]
MSKKRYLFKSEINSFHYLYQDAEYLLSAAKLPQIEGTFQSVRISRSAFLLFILSLEGLINRALDHFAPQPLHDFLIEKEEKFSTIDKWRLLALTAGNPPTEINIGTYPWSHFAELIRVRNNYVHPKHDRMGYYEFVNVKEFKHLPWNNIPENCGLKEGSIVYGQTKIPKDPYGFNVKHLEPVHDL